jgi:uncharacterized protein (TIGR03067 family)
MMRSTLLFVLVLGMSVSAAPIPKGLINQQADQKQLVGEWHEPPEKARVWWFKEDGTAGGGAAKKQNRKGIYRIDRTTDPKSLDWSDDNGETWLPGVYSLEGDKLTVNIAIKLTDPRPTSIVETEHSNSIVATKHQETK